MGSFLERQFTYKQKGKINPNSIRRLFFDVVQVCFSGNQTKAADDIQEHLSCFDNVSSSAIYRTKKLTRAMLNRINEDKTCVQYWHLETIARFLNIPTGLLLLFTRMQSNQRNGAILDENVHILRAVRRICDEHEVNRVMDFAQLGKWIEIYEEETGGRINAEKKAQQSHIRNVAQ